MADILAKICEVKRDHIEQCKSAVPHSELKKKLPADFAVRSFSATLKNSSISGYGLIAEIKKASPSKGLIREDFSPKELALSYQRGGASCLSVLTDEPFFMGRNDFLTSVREISSLPILRKDFMLDHYQVTEARVLGADCILLIMAALDGNQADEIYDEANKKNLTVIVEVHNKKEAEIALKYQNALIGINNRNLETLEISINNTISIFDVVKDHKSPIISESGIKNENDAKYIYDKTGIKNFLIGESLLSSDNPAALIKKIIQIYQ